MLRPSYNDLMNAVNSGVEEGEQPVINSRYSIVIATSKRARQIIAGEEPLVKSPSNKPLSSAIGELCSGKVRIVSEDEHADDRIEPEPAKAGASEDVQES